MEELLRKYKNSIKKILQDYVARDQPINDANIHSAEFLSSLEVIFRHGIQSQVSGSLVTLWNFFCQLSRLGGDIGLQGSLIEKEVYFLSKEWTTDESKARMWIRYALNNGCFNLVQYLLSDQKLMDD